MSVGGKIRLFGYYLKDMIKFKKNDRICQQWRDIENTLSNYSQGWPKVENTLQQYLDYAAENCEFYKPYKGKKLQDFPIMNKMDFIENYDKIKNPRYKDSDLHKTSTSGSTGTPFTIIQDRAKRNRVLAELKYMGETAGYASHEKMVFFRAKKTPSWKSMFWSNVWQPDCSNLSEKNIRKLYDFQNNAVCILGYPSALNDMIKKWTSMGLAGSKTVKLIMTGAEFLPDDTRELCLNFWKNANIVSRYSNMENGIIAQEIIGQKNIFNINWSSYFIEILKLDSDEPAAEGELGRIIITDMYNKAFPMIRYDNGDIGSIISQNNGFPVFSRIDGRKDDLVYATDGSMRSANAIGNIMHGLEGNIRQWQFVQEDQKNYKIIFSAENESQAAAGIAKKIPQLTVLFGQDAVFSTQYTTEIPVLNSGKRKRIVQKYKKESEK